MKKYEAYVRRNDDLISYFEEKLSEIDAVIIHQEWIRTTEDEVYRHYIIEAEEGTINPRFELKEEGSE